MTKTLLSASELKKIENTLNLKNGVIAFPTDTVWGIGCLVENKDAVKRIYAVKNRPQNKPLILLGSKIEYLAPYVAEINEKAMQIINEYMPGAITLVLVKSDKTPDYITSGFNTVGIRIPNHPVLLEILEYSVKEHVLATTSANISGENACINYEEVVQSIGFDVDYIAKDYEFTAKCTASTIIAFDDANHVKILRQGEIKII